MSSSIGERLAFLESRIQVLEESLNMLEVHVANQTHIEPDLEFLRPIFINHVVESDHIPGP